jgi:hypothetical protein
LKLSSALDRFGLSSSFGDEQESLEALTVYLLDVQKWFVFLSPLLPTKWLLVLLNVRSVNLRNLPAKCRSFE